MLETVTATCPYCWQPVELTVDCSAGDADYVEDCTVCCRPMRVRTGIGPDATVATLEVDRENP